MIFDRMLKPVNFALSAMMIVGLSSSASAQMFKPSKNDQLKAGSEYALKIRKESKILPDNDPRVVLLRSMGNKMLASRSASDAREPWKYTFDVIESKEVNAFAVPGGPIFFFSGLIDRMTTVEELAGVLGHEIQHIRREHWASAVNAQQERQAGIILLGALLGASRQQMEIAAIIETVGFDLPTSRGQEREADRFGMDTVVRAGYNPRGMVNVFRMFQTLKAKTGSNPEFLNTHPDDKARIANLEQMIVQYQTKGLVPKNLNALTTLPFETIALKELKNPPKSGTPSTGTNGKVGLHRVRLSTFAFGSYDATVSCAHFDE
jgi:beta-barrel assembly-enhancing protease